MEAMVIGGGVAGPVAAIALRRVGWDVTVYEAYADPAGDVGSFVSLGDNGLRALAAIGCRDAVAARGTELPLLRLRSGRGKLLGEASRRRVTLMRGHLVETLRDLAVDAGARIVTGRRLTGVDAHRTAVFADGSTATADLIVGADGIHSRLRTVIDAAAPTARYAGLWTVGGRSAHRIEPGAFTVMFGAKATMVSAPTDAGTLWAAQVPAPQPPSAQVPGLKEPRQQMPAAQMPAARGPGAQPLGAQMPGARTPGAQVSGAQMPAAQASAAQPLAAQSGLPGDHEVAGVGEFREQVAALFDRDQGPAARLVRHTAQWHPRIAMQAMPGGVPRWHRDRMVLLGDAAHPMGAGQGANLAVEDAVVLARCLRDAPELDAALSRYEELRRPRTDRMLKVAGANQDAKVAGPFAARVRDVMMPFFFKRFAEQGGAWMHDYDVEWNTVSTPTSATT